MHLNSEKQPAVFKIRTRFAICRDVKGQHQTRVQDMDLKDSAAAMNGFMPPSSMGWSDDEGSPEHPKAKRFKV